MAGFLAFDNKENQLYTLLRVRTKKEEVLVCKNKGMEVTFYEQAVYKWPG